MTELGVQLYRRKYGTYIPTTFGTTETLSETKGKAQLDAVVRGRLAAGNRRPSRCRHATAAALLGGVTIGDSCSSTAFEP
jgi:hypothetical protein